MKDKKKTYQQLNEEQELGSISTQLDQNMRIMDRLFDKVDVILKRRFKNCMEDGLEFCIYFMDGIVNSSIINEHIIEPLLVSDKMLPGDSLLEQVKDEFIMANDIKEAVSFQELIPTVTYGDTILFVQNCSRALVISTKNFSLRGITEPESEKVLTGPREGFNEGILSNLSMLRRRLRTNRLKMEMKSIGRQSATGICLCYIDGIVSQSILEELTRRIDDIDIDAVLDSNYIAEYICERSPVAIPTHGTTERPDIVAAKLLEGRIAIFVDGSPVVLTVPHLFLENFQSNEDYYVNAIYATITRIIRIAGFFLTISIPAIYIAIVAFHPEILPTSLMISFSVDRMGVPLPASVECLIMNLCFDVLKEAGVRMPTQVGQAMSIVGALVIGQAGVEANLVAAPMIIVVALTAITGLMLPKLNASTMCCRYALLLLASCLGIYGLLIGMSMFFIHLLDLRSIGVSSLILPKNLEFQDIKDSFIRTPWPGMLTRYTPFTKNLVRAKPAKRLEKKGEGK